MSCVHDTRRKMFDEDLHHTWRRNNRLTPFSSDRQAYNKQCDQRRRKQVRFYLGSFYQIEIRTINGYTEWIRFRTLQIYRSGPFFQGYLNLACPKQAKSLGKFRVRLLSLLKFFTSQHILDYLLKAANLILLSGRADNVTSRRALKDSNCLMKRDLLKDILPFVWNYNGRFFDNTPEPPVAGVAMSTCTCIVTRYRYRSLLTFPVDLVTFLALFDFPVFCSVSTYISKQMIHA